MEHIKPILQMRNIHKRFPGVVALKGVNFRLFPGEIHALMGENGAGKSTLIKVLTGVYDIDEGSMELNGEPLKVMNPLAAQDAGISTVYQEVNLCPNLSVAENIFIGREPRRFGRIQWKELNRKADQLLQERLRLKIDVTRTLDSYSVAVQQLVAIARALNISARIVILDEPTSSLDRSEVKELFRVMRHLKEQGLAILFVTHFLDQVYEITDRMTILRNGECIGEYMTQELTRIELVSHMIGKDLEMLADLPKEDAAHAHAPSETFLEAKGLGRKGAIEPFDFRIRRGEIVGLAGLLGSGRTELARLLFGADRADRGSLTVAGGGTIHSPREAIRQKIAFCSENRKAEGIIGDLTVRENLILALQAHKGLAKLAKKQQEAFVDEYMHMLNIHPPNPDQLIKHLSGGNQQKVLLARWLLMQPDLLILDEPTRGIDVGAKAEIQKLVMDLAKRGMAVLFISSELEEVLRVSHRIAVLRDRSLVKELTGDQINEQNVMQVIAGER